MLSNRIVIKEMNNLIGQFRIVKRIMNNGNEWFSCQKRYWFGWKNFTREYSWDDSYKLVTDNIEDLMEAFNKKIDSIKGRKLEKTEIVKEWIETYD